MKRRLCSCALINGHYLNCPYKNVIIAEGSVTIDFSALRKMIEEMEKRVIRENSKKTSRRKKTRIFVAPVIKKQKKTASEGEHCETS